MTVAMHAHASLWYHITVGINFHGWENFVTVKSTTKITKISTLIIAGLKLFGMNERTDTPTKNSLPQGLVTASPTEKKA